MYIAYVRDAGWEVILKEDRNETNEGGACLQRLVFVLQPRTGYLEEILYNFGVHCGRGGEKQRYRFGQGNWVLVTMHRMICI